MNITHRIALTAAALLAACIPGTAAYAAAACAPGQPCEEVPAFAAAVASFRSSVAGGDRRVMTSLRFTNKTDQPLVLGYVKDSAVVTDELGNRYVIPFNSANGVRAIGLVDNRTFDPKFVLQPGESSEARFELYWGAGKTIAGTRFQLELAVREIEPIAGDQFRLGKEHALRFAGLTDGAVADSATAVDSAAAAAAVPASASGMAEADPCAGNPRCHSSGAFVAEIVQLSSSQPGSVHTVHVNVRFRNLTDQPLILAYQKNSGSMLDNYGNRYVIDWRSDANVKGIGQTDHNHADPQFMLSPGASRTASFEYSRYPGKSAIGTVFSPDFVVEQLQILPSQQIRSVREYSVSFANLAVSSFAAAPAADAVDTLNNAGRQIAEGLKSIFGRKDR